MAKLLWKSSLQKSFLFSGGDVGTGGRSWEILEKFNDLDKPSFLRLKATAQANCLPSKFEPLAFWGQNVRCLEINKWQLIPSNMNKHTPKKCAQQDDASHFNLVERGSLTGCLPSANSRAAKLGPRQCRIENAMPGDHATSFCWPFLCQARGALPAHHMLPRVGRLSHSAVYVRRWAYQADR